MKKGEKCSFEHRRKISIANKKYYKIHIPKWAGKSLSKKHRKQISKNQKGKNNSFYGKHHSRKIRKIISESQIGIRHHRWRGGKYKNGSGYIFILQPNHPFCNTRGYVLEHRLVMEKHLGHYLKPAEVVHHINGILDDNRLENLMLFPNSKAHLKFHYSIRRKALEFFYKHHPA